MAEDSLKFTDADMDRFLLKALPHISEAVSDVLEEALKQREKHAPEPPPFSKGIDGHSSPKTSALAGTVLCKAIDKYSDGEVSAKAFAEKHFGDPVQKALTSGNVGSGGAFVEEAISDDYIEMLRPRAAMRQFDFITVPLPTGGVSVPQIRQGLQGFWVGESMEIPYSDMKTGKQRLESKQLGVLTAVSNDLLKRAREGSVSTALLAMIEAEAVQAHALLSDISLTRKYGTEYSPMGLRWQMDQDNVKSAPDDGSFASVLGALGSQIDILESANVTMDNLGWLAHGSFYNFLAYRCLRPNSDDAYFQKMLSDGHLLGFKRAKMNQMPKNLGVGADRTEAMLLDIDAIRLGSGGDLEVLTSVETSYTNAEGDRISAFVSNSTVLKLIVAEDILLRTPESVAVLDNIGWHNN